MAELYKQVLLQYESSAKERCWIKSTAAKVGKRVIDDDTKLIAKVLEVADSTHTLEELEINRYNPLRRATDI